MSQDDKVIAYISADELAGLMRDTGMISVHESTIAEGHPVIHASLKVVHAETGEELPGGLPFSVVLFKGAREPGCSNIAIGTVVPAAELDIVLAADFFNSCNQRYRFIRAFPLDSTSFVIQMDMFVRNATREYIKFGFGLWAAMFSQVLFELVGRGSQSLGRAAEAFAAVPRGSILSRYVDAIATEPVLAERAELAPEPVREPEPRPFCVEEDVHLESDAVRDAETIPEAGTPPAAEAEKAVESDVEPDAIKSASHEKPVDAEKSVEPAEADEPAAAKHDAEEKAEAVPA